MTEDEQKAVVAKIVKDIFVLADIDDPSIYPVSDHALWFPWAYDRAQSVDGTPAGARPLVIRPGEPLGLNRDFSVFTFFADDEEIRVYCILNNEKPTIKPLTLCRCYLLSRSQPTYVCQGMSLDVFKQCIADEWSEVATGLNTGEAMLQSIVDYIDSLPEDYSLKKLRDDIEAGTIDVPEEPEGEPAPNGAAATPVDPPVEPDSAEG